MTDPYILDTDLRQELDDLAAELALDPRQMFNYLLDMTLKSLRSWRLEAFRPPAPAEYVSVIPDAALTFEGMLHVLEMPAEPTTDDAGRAASP